MNYFMIVKDVATRVRTRKKGPMRLFGAFMIMETCLRPSYDDASRNQKL